MTQNQIIVVGGGLAGLSSAHSIYERGGNVLVIDKMAFFGGNSTRATSGINGSGTSAQRALNIPDTPEAFYNDSAKAARDLIRPPLSKVLTHHSASAVEWLQSSFNLELSKVSRLGGHSFPRTHRGPERFPGMTITYALMVKLEDISRAEPHRVRTLVKARVTGLIKTQDGAVIGVNVEVVDGNGKISQIQEYGAVILATGGYAADFTDTSLLKKYRPDIFDLPTTNGEYSTGDGVKIASAINASTVDLDRVQVHPTGIVDPTEPKAKVKFLAAEALRGVGGIILNAKGERFIDELEHRDVVTAAIWKNNNFPMRLILNSKSANTIDWHIKHYAGRGLCREFKDGYHLAQEMNVSPQTLTKTFKDYNEGAKSGKDKFGKKYFDGTPYDMNETFFALEITPVLHFTMGGVEIDEHGHVLDSSRKPIPGLFACGEVAGGVHGAQRLGGSSLLGCVVFGRVAGNTASSYLLQKLVNKGDSGSKPLTIHLDTANKKLEILWDDSVQSAKSTQRTASAEKGHQENIAVAQTDAKTTKPQSTTRDIKAAEVMKHNKPDDCWLVVNRTVLNVTKFLKDHPGGQKVILKYAGLDASVEFNMFHQPNVVEKYAPYTIIGKISESEVRSLNEEEIMFKAAKLKNPNSKL